MANYDQIKLNMVFVQLDIILSLHEYYSTEFLISQHHSIKCFWEGVIYVPIQNMRARNTFGYIWQKTKSDGDNRIKRIRDRKMQFNQNEYTNDNNDNNSDIH